jgi:hypothetical protein
VRESITEWKSAYKYSFQPWHIGRYWKLIYSIWTHFIFYRPNLNHDYAIIG